MAQLENLADWRWMRRACIVAVVLAVVGGWLGYGSFGHFLIVVALLVLTGVPLSIWFLAWLIWLALRRPVVHAEDRGTVLFGPVLLVLALGVFASWPLGLVIGQPLRENAKRWALEQTEAIDAYRDTHGMYPMKLSDVADVSSAPRLIRNGFVAYLPSETHYSFFMGDGLFSDEWAWSSASRTR